MDKFPEWADKLLKADAGGVRPHTLNLVLKLKQPGKLPLMLIDITTSQPTIQRALKDLAFLHFARFLPSWDGTALVVVTEFDGPMKPYVMDFVIALGDVFNKLLSYVEEAPPLPVQKYPDEFWTFVEKWNRVPYGPRSGNSTGNVFPVDYDYPVFSAYAGKSVVDIAGPRDSVNDSLRPALDRRAAHVNPANVQGNILVGFRAMHASHLMLRVTDAAKARVWLSQLPVQDAQPWKSRPRHPLLTVAFTFQGMSALLPSRAEDLDRFPTAFRQGAAERAPDNGDIGEKSEPAAWKFGQPDKTAVDVVISAYLLDTVSRAERIADPALPRVDRAVLDADVARLLAAASMHGLVWVHTAQADALPEDRVYFGLRDGITEPRIAGQEMPKGERLAMQPASSPGEFLLGSTYDSIYGGESLARHMPSDLASDGCFGAMRLIEQHVDEFEQCTTDLAARFGISPSDAASRLLGRWPDGQPLSQHPTKPKPLLPGADPRNDFDYAPSWEYPHEPLDHQGDRCPLDAHIRRTNPRSHHAPGMRHTRRVLRRGMPAQWTDKAGQIHQGLLGLFLCADLERQFEFMQRHWIQGGESGHSDAISGVRSEATPFRWAPGVTVNIPPLVSTRGSLYLFFPGMQALRRLPELAHPGPALPPQQSWPEPQGLERLIRVRWQAIRHLPPRGGEWLIEWLAAYVLPSKSFANLVKGLLPQSPPDLDNLPKTHGRALPALGRHFITNPCWRYRRLRSIDQNFFWEPSHGAFLALRRTEVQRILTDVQDFVQADSKTRMHGIITLDGAEHAVVRRAFWDSLQAPMAAVTTNLDRSFQDRWAPLQNLQQFDLVRDLGVPVLNEVYWDLFGLPQSDRQACSHHAGTAMRQFSQPGARRGTASLAASDALVRLGGRLALNLAQAMLWDLSPWGSSPYEGTLLGGLATRTRINLPGLRSLAGPQRTVDFVTMVFSLVQFVLAGHLAPQLLFSSAARNFLAHTATPKASVWQHIARLPTAGRRGALGIALEESRRFDPPVTIIQRYTARTVSIGGVTLPKDTPVFAVAASANRDGCPKHNLEQFVWDRVPAPQHFSLGAGPHHCIGAALQELILPRLIGQLMDQLPDLKLVDPQAVPAWIDNIYFRGLESLPVSTG